MVTGELVMLKFQKIIRHKNYAYDGVLYADGDDGGTGLDMYSLIKWDLSSLQRSNDILSVSISLYLTNSTVQPYKFFEVLQDWSESKVTWQEYDKNKLWSESGAKKIRC